MIIDHLTQTDLGIFQPDHSLSVFQVLNFTQTTAGAANLHQMLSTPLPTTDAILENQQIIKTIVRITPHWPKTITNGTLMVIRKFYDSQIDSIPAHPTLSTALLYKLLHHPDFSLIKYTLQHIHDFLSGLQKIVSLLQSESLPITLQKVVSNIEGKFSNPTVAQFLSHNKVRQAGNRILAQGHFFLYKYKETLEELILLHGKLEAWLSLAISVNKYQLHFPEVTNDPTPVFDAQGLWHILLPNAIGYDIHLNQNGNFIFLTGANMAGKSTFIKAVGIAVYLAHLGMAVPAQKMRVSTFHGLITNIQVTDNLAKGESFFFNEVTRVKNTLLRITDGNKWLVLIDELFKGTNVEDAMRCSIAVIQGLLQIKNALFILSTHLYEIGDSLHKYPNVNFRYFETQVHNDQLSFSYQLKEGISTDRIGYIILKREGVLDIIDRISAAMTNSTSSAS